MKQIKIWINFKASQEKFVNKMMEPTLKSM